MTNSKSDYSLEYHQTMCNGQQNVTFLLYDPRLAVNDFLSKHKENKAAISQQPKQVET